LRILQIAHDVIEDAAVVIIRHGLMQILGFLWLRSIARQCG
jgi:hypothetical protein